MQVFEQGLRIVLRLEPRDVFIGGRTEAIQLYADTLTLHQSCAAISSHIDIASPHHLADISVTLTPRHLSISF